MESKVEAEVTRLPAGSPEPGSAEVFGELTVGRVLRPGEVGRGLRPCDSLGDLADVLEASDRTAMAVVDGGQLVGLVTESDVMRAFFEGVSPETRLSVWLDSSKARASPSQLERLVVPPSALLVDVAEKMVSNALAGDCACHHAVVHGLPLTSPGAEKGFGVVSSHDLVRALCHSDSWARSQEAEVATSSLCVMDVMKEKDRIFTCPPSDTLLDATELLLMTQQSSVLVLDETSTSISGFITPRDVVKAFADGCYKNATIGEWMRERAPRVDRAITSDLKLDAVAAAMTNRKVDHLAVLRLGSTDVIGVVSSLDILLYTRARAPFLRSMPLWKGPAVAEHLAQNQSTTVICPRGCTFGQVADVLVDSSCTSAVVEMTHQRYRATLLTENDIVRAYINGKGRDDDVEAWMSKLERSFLQVLPSTPLTEAASLMLMAAEQHGKCHHLVVTDLAGAWLGIFSALDIARALNGLSTELDIARTGMHTTTVGMVMKSIASPPRCKLTDSIRDALAIFGVSGQNAVIVEDDGKVHGLVTPRCAVEALRCAYPPDSLVSDWLRDRRRAQKDPGEVQEGPRRVLSTTPLSEAARIMAEHALHHLLVYDGPKCQLVGVLSSLDIARGLVSINSQCPFISLGWLQQLLGPTALAKEVDGGAAEDKVGLKRCGNLAVGDAEASESARRRQWTE